MSKPSPPPPPSPSRSGGHIIPRVIEEEMKTAYVNYAMSVIVGRALPDVRDGLKPVHRRILYSMHELGLQHHRSFKKSARIVGECLGKFHPHGDIAIYDSLVRMAQDFSLRYPLVKGQGNFGSVDGDNAAHQRYTEAKLTPLAGELLQDLDKNTVTFRDNFDGSLKEPEVLPSIVPQLLINGSSGIAVGMTTNIPPHNLREICQALITLIDHPELSTEELLRLVPGPDFPTGGEVYCGPALAHAYAKGRGKVIIKAVTHLEGEKIIVTEIPYQVNKAELIEQIADLVREKRIPDIRNINDESDREGIRIVIDLKRDADAQVVLNQLYQYSRLQVSYGIILLALVKQQPRLLGLRELLQHHIQHRKEVITRRTQYDLQQAQQRLHIVDGLLIALDHLDDVIPGIRQSRTVEDAQQFLMGRYQLTIEQAKAILDLRLQKLASLEQEHLRNEHGELQQHISGFQELLASEQKILHLIKEEAQEIQRKYGDARRSKIIPTTDEDSNFDMEELIDDEQIVVTMTRSGYIKRLPLTTYKTQRRGGKGIKATGTKEEDVVDWLSVTNAHAHLLVFTNQGQMYWLKAWQVPEASRQAKGKHIAQVLELKPDEQVTAIVPVQDFKEGYLVLATRQGTIKRVELLAFANPRRGGIRAISLEPGDTLVEVNSTTGQQEIILATRQGSANHFQEQDVRTMGRTAYGVRGIRLEEGDEVIGMVVAEKDQQLLTITEKGYGKMTPIQEYRLCNRGGKGVTNIKITEKNGPVKIIMLMEGNEEVMLVSQQGIAIRMRAADISSIGRATQGVRIMRLEEGDQVAAAAKIAFSALLENGEQSGGELPIVSLEESSEEKLAEKNEDNSSP